MSARYNKRFLRELESAYVPEWVHETIFFATMGLTAALVVFWITAIVYGG